MTSPNVDALVRAILDALPRYADLDGAVEGVRRMVESLGVVVSEEDLRAAREIVSRQHDIEILHTYSIIQPRPNWYLGPQGHDIHWPALKGYLTAKYRWPGSVVEMLDDTSNQIVALLSNPKEEQAHSRGLVVGYVQSGKTANMTAVIAKALDAGYNTVIVLAGMTSKLRAQTQSRLVRDLVGRHPTSWQVLTPPIGDFRAPPHGGFLHHTDKAQMAIVKKNVSPLRHLKRAIEETPPVTLKRLRVLVIDDECDQASVNSARSELDMTAINARIRELLSMFPAVSYVGYTATPFANVLISPYVGDAQDLDDLYPRDFITALPKPPGYFGAEDLFGRPPADAANPNSDEEGLDMIRVIPEEDEHRLQPQSARDRALFQPRMAASLEVAIIYYLACCAARRARGDADRHMTMLVHTSAYVNMHERVAAVITKWKESMRDDFLNRSSAIGRQLETVWQDEQGRIPDEVTTARRVSSEEIAAHLEDVLEALEVAVENAPSGSRIDYTGSPRIYIVVGGTILSRGLTLEGLMVSYFLRAANQYDTLLQMGRWFGFRPGYEDLPRIWTTDHLRQQFRALAAVESEIREDIGRYRIEKLTPMESAVRIRAIPGMAITGSNKMRAARRCAVSFWGTHKQTIRFTHKDEARLIGNWRAGAELVNRAEESGLRDRGHRSTLWRRVPKSLIQEFFATYETYKTHPTHDLAPQILMPFLETEDQRLDYWNVGIVEPTRRRHSAAPLGTVGPVALNIRSRLKGGGDAANIKALMSRVDITFDCATGGDPQDSWDEQKRRRSEVVGEVPLLLLYAIDKDSAPNTEGVRKRLGAVTDVLGFGIVFPGDKTEGGRYVSVELLALSADEIEDIEAEELQQAEAAGVR